MTQPALKKQNNKMRRFEQFCQLTTLHGYSYLQSENNSIALKIFWLVIIMIMTCTVLMLLVWNTNKFLEFKTIATIETLSAPLNVSFVNDIKALNSKVIHATH